jgi:hydrogenase maturation protease
LAADSGWRYRVHKLASPAELIWHVQSGAPTVIIDACRSGQAPGTVLHLELDRLPQSLGSHRSTHGFSLADVLRLAASLGAPKQRLSILAVEIGPVRPAGEVTAAGHDAVGRLEQELRAEIGRATAVGT